MKLFHLHQNEMAMNTRCYNFKCNSLVYLDILLHIGKLHNILRQLFV